MNNPHLSRLINCVESAADQLKDRQRSVGLGFGTMDDLESDLECALKALAAYRKSQTLED